MATGSQQGGGASGGGGGDVAIVGMACLFPGAPDLATFAANLRAGKDAISEVPAGRWDAAFYDPEAAPGAVDRFYCKRGGFVDAAGAVRFDAVAHGVMPVAARSAEPDQLIALDVAVRALADAGLEGRDFDRARAGVILGRGNYAGVGRTRLTEHVRGAEQLVRALRSLVPSLDDAQLAEVKRQYRARLGGVGEGGDAIGLVPNLTASRIAHRLDLGGPAYTVDAACASALLAVDQAVTQLRAGRLDVVVAGGVHFCQDEAFWSVFCQLGALSRHQQIRPFDRRADGILIGEGAGIVVLRRREDAERDGDRIYALIRGTGSASDGREASLMNPSVAGQVLALERAWRDAGVDPATVGMIEAHGTGTPAGDAAELETLRRVFGDGAAAARAADDRPVLGSVKSMIGHAMPAAGAAGLIKAALALSAGERWPTLHCEDPHPALATTRFRTIAAAEPWAAEDGLPRRAGVNAFGFGGIDAHLVLEEAPDGAGRGRARGRSFAAAAASSIRAPGVVPGGASAASPAATARAAQVPRVLALAAASPAALSARLEALGAGPLPDAARPILREGEGGVRLALLEPTPERLARARVVVEKGKPWRGREGIFFTTEGLLAGGGRIAFAYPGVDASFKPRLDDVGVFFGHTLPPEVREQRNAGERTIEEIGLGLVAVGRFLHDALAELGVRPDVALGHSVGEWTAMITSGMIPAAEVDAFISTVRPGTLEVPGVFFAALGCGEERALAAMADLPSIAVSHDNCPRQVIVCGIEASIDELLLRLRKDSVLGQKLPFRSGFHSPLFAGHIEPHVKNFAALPIATPSLPLYSATSADRFPDDPDAVRTLAIEHLVRPVRFRELVQRLHAEGVRAFVQVGTGSLVGFIEDSLRGLPHVAVAANVPDRTGMEQLVRVCAQLFVEGAEPRWERLAPPAPEPSHEPQVRTLPLALGLPLVEFDAPLRLPAAAVAAAGAPAPAAPAARLAALGLQPGVASVFAEMMGAIERASADVISLLESPPAGAGAGAIGSTARAAAAPVAREVRVVRRLSVDTHPWLVDHTFFRQPPGWPNVADRHPVVPMTTSIGFMLAEAEALVPGTVAVGIEDVRAFRWLAVPGPTDVTFELRFDGKERVAVSIDGYAEGTVVLAAAYPAAPSAPPLLLSPLTPRPEAGERATSITAERLYAERWMFHGPAYQGVRALGPMSDGGLRGELEAGAAPGALLDNAGQLFGFWVMQACASDRLAMPVGIERIRFFGPHPRPGARLRCDVRIRVLEQRRVTADLTMADAATGRVFCEIGSWEDRRFDTDPRLWDVLIWPERSLLAEPAAGGFMRFHDIYRSAATREQLMRRYLSERERALYEAQPPRGQRAHLAGRIALKDAVRDLLWRRGHGALFPIEISVENDASGKPLVRAPGGLDLRVSLAHKGDVAVALVAEERDVGIDIETVEPRPAGFAELAFSEDELALRLPGEDEAELMTRLWTAKEAVGKLLGSGLAGNPRKWRVTDRTGERLLCHGHQVETRREGDHVIGWTYAP